MAAATLERTLSLPRTKAALAAWDALTQEWQSADTQEQIVRLIDKDEDALDALRHAFHEETSDRNTWSQASALQPDKWLRELVTRFP